MDRFVEVEDNGVGIPAENLRDLSHGFTTRKNGHGFGLHSGALAAKKQMGGSLLAESAGRSGARGSRWSYLKPELNPSANFHPSGSKRSQHF